MQHVSIDERWAVHRSGETVRPCNTSSSSSQHIQVSARLVKQQGIKSACGLVLLFQHGHRLRARSAFATGVSSQILDVLRGIIDYGKIVYVHTYDKQAPPVSLPIFVRQICIYSIYSILL